MAYTALYRKWRPETFEDVKGQDPIVTALKNQVISGRIGHAYLFCGTRGTGKTTAAKILARAVNCEHPVNGSPCGECESCRAIRAGASMNVIEIDAASNNGVDNIREIRDEVAHPPLKGKYLVYIIDEVHMLSTGAFNALLKTLEEPPAYVIFILATTEVNKIPITVLSRCQRYDFRRISTQTIYERLRQMADTEKIPAEEKALRFIAKKGDGSLRDAISLFDQCAAFYYGQELTYDRALTTLGAVNTEVLLSLLQSTVAGDAAGGLRLIERVSMEGRDLAQFVSDFIWYLRCLMLLKASDVGEDTLEMSQEDISALKEEAKKVDMETVMRCIRIFSDLSGQMRYASNRRVLLEIAVIRLSRPQMDTDLSAVLERLDQVEKKLENGVKLTARPAPSAAAAPEAEDPGPQEVKLPAADVSDYNELKDRWLQVCGRIDDPMLSEMVKKAAPRPTGGGSLQVVFTGKDIMDYRRASRCGGEEKLAQAAANVFEKNFTFHIVYDAEGSSLNETYVAQDKSLSEVFHMPVEIEN